VKKKVEKQVVEEVIVTDSKNTEKKVKFNTGKMKPNPKWTY